MTNGANIRSMSNFRLAEFLSQVVDCCFNSGRFGECDEDCPMYRCCNDCGVDNVEDWLEQEVYTE